MPDRRSTDLGKVRCNLKGRVVAGSWQTCVLTYTAGFAGIDDTGSLKVVTRYATDAGTPQFDDPAAPHYTTAVASNGARLQLRYDVKDNVRPWGRTIHLKVLQGFLRKGDTITLTIGDRSGGPGGMSRRARIQRGGSPGWRMQTFCEDTFELRVLIDRYATYVYKQVPTSPTFRIVAGDPVKLVAVAPSLVPPGKKFVIRWKLEDAWGNPVGRPRRMTHAGFAEAGCYTVPVRDEKTGLHAKTNPIVVRDGDEFGRFWADMHGQSEETIGTNSIDDYFRFARDVAFLDACTHQGNDFQITDAFWRNIQQTTREFYQPGKFVTFPGWEWSGNTGLGGDRNVLFQEEGGPIHRSSRALVGEREAKDPCCEDVEELFGRLRKLKSGVMLVPHVGGRYADLQRHDEQLEPVVEVHSAWGTFEWMLDDAFQRGYRIGVVANSDGHKGRPGASYPGASTFGSYGGLTCILAERLDRDAVWEAYQSRRVYATTGVRILLDVATADGAPMGSVLKIDRDTVLEFHVSVHGTAPIERVDVCNALHVLKSFRTFDEGNVENRVKVLWQGAEVRGRGRQVEWDGCLRVHGNQIAGFQPINFHNPEHVCRQSRTDELQWQSITTGGVAGVIVTLGRRGTGRLEVQTKQTSFTASVTELGIDGVAYELGGVGKRIAAYRLPAAGGSCSLSFRYQPDWGDLHSGDNPILIRVVQEDGHLAWSSPVYLVRS